jgi:hypothetical protein
VQVDHGLQRRGPGGLVELLLGTTPVRQGGQLRHVGGGPPGEPGEPPGHVVAVPAGLAADDEPAARLEHAEHLAERQLDVRDVVDHGMPDHQVELVVVVRELLGVGDLALDREAERVGVPLGRLDHAG